MFEKFVEVINSAPMIKHFDMRNKDVKMKADQTLKVLTAINNSNIVANLETIHLGHFDEKKHECIKYCDLSDKESREMLWRIL